MYNHQKIIGAVTAAAISAAIFTGCKNTESEGFIHVENGQVVDGNAKFRLM